MRTALRKATIDDTPAIERLIAVSVRTLGLQDYTSEQIEAALGTVWAVDTLLIRDGTYFVIEADGEIVACGGWSKRHTLFGGDRQPGREATLLYPNQDPARIRAFFVHPKQARQGLGGKLLEHCERDAVAAGFRSLTLVATLPGRRLYQKYGCVDLEAKHYVLKHGLTIEFVTMCKEINASK